MIRNILELAALGGVALTITAIIWWFRTKGKPQSCDWWDSEGIVWFFLVAFGLFCVACGFGVFGIEHP